MALLQKPGSGFGYSLKDGVAKENQGSPEEDEGAAELDNAKADDEGGFEGGIQVAKARKPRGRPPGSKNKPKPPLVITRESEEALRPHVIEVANGADVYDSISVFTSHHRRGICILSATGSVSNVTLRQPGSPASTLTFHGRFEVLSLSGAFLHQPSSSSLTISLAGSQGQILGGTVAGILTAVSPFLVIAVSFANPGFHRLPSSPPASEDENQKPLPHPPPPPPPPPHRPYPIANPPISPSPLQVVLPLQIPSSSGVETAGFNGSNGQNHLTHDVFATWSATTGSRQPPPSY